MNYADFSEDERKFYLQEAGFDSREEKLFRLRAYDEKTLWEAWSRNDTGRMQRNLCAISWQTTVIS